MSTDDKIYATIKSVAKIILHSRKGLPFKGRTEKSLIILANGPSLSGLIETKLALLQQSDTMAVNFAAVAPSFFLIKPKNYILADPHFFGQAEEGSNLEKLRIALAAVDWPMTLYVPSDCYASYYSNPSITIRRFNAVGVEGFSSFSHMAYRNGWGMPRPRNVLIPAIMVAIAEGYGTIYITGADHSWMSTISVTDDNEVVSVQPHFYNDSEHEQERVRHEYKGYRLHQIVESFAVAFRSYHQIVAYADSLGVKIYNATPGSFIDAFPRKKL